ncbi:hypothetical protein CLV92_110150 [Kineococcus xinjiangensis]|uniref:Tetratricopeptide repeat protein n=1 Tax=Kineococcus xinjiangensis TaxID=512762 RepID=A0A2S6IH28_9ACTN|nr:hypothetical protein [Kineococcus xinjiangensis]PPK93522.1 hypothetical protein CLV92_110150 [Kineococcus xinjiangensis]
MLVLELPRALLDSAAPAVERQLARRPDGWSGLAARGRLRRFRGDADGLADLDAAAGEYLRVSAGRNPDLLIPVNLHRLAGSGRGAPLLDRLHAELLAVAERHGHCAARTGVLVDVCFLRGDDAGAEAALRALLAADPWGVQGTRHPWVARLARAMATGDVAACGEAVAWFDALVAREPGSFADAAGPNAYDWLELALVAHAELTGEASPRLFEL